jgi:serine/threonine protein phosphatase PrpC
MVNQSKKATLLAAASRAGKPGNQDAWAVVRNPLAGLNAVIVADGVGSHYGAAEAAAVAVEAVRRELACLEAAGPLSGPGALLVGAQRELESYVAQRRAELPAGLNADNSFGTTLLCAVETAERICAAYAGNGALLHLRANFSRFPSTLLWPWSVMNYLNPHAVPKQGRNVLYQIVSPFAPIQFTEFAFSKDERLFGDVIVACTDGICSADEVPAGKDPQGRVWVQAEPHLLLLLRHLSEFFRQGEYSDAVLQVSLEKYLDELVQGGLIDDDSTVAVLVTSQALNYHLHLNDRRCAEE